MTKYNTEFRLGLVNEFYNSDSTMAGLDRKYELPKGTLRKWVSVFKKLGAKGLELRKEKRIFTTDLKLSVVNYYLSNDEVSVTATATAFDLLPSQVSTWVKLFKANGADALKPKRKGRPTVKKKIKQKKQAVSKAKNNELEVLREQLHQVTLERDILKKSLALFGPSKRNKKQ